MEFRYYSKLEYNKLPHDQKEELRNFRNAKRQAGHSPKLSNGNKKQKPDNNKRFNKQIKRAVSLVVAEMVKGNEKPEPVTADISAVQFAPAATKASSILGTLRRNIQEQGKKST